MSSIALLTLPQAGNTVANRRKDSSRYTETPSLTANGQTPPTACPTSASASSGESIFAFAPKNALNLWLSTFASPAQTTSTARPPAKNESVLAMRHGSHPSACAASSTVALERSSSRTRPSSPNPRR